MTMVLSAASTPHLPHSCARHRNPADARRRGGKTFSQPKDLGWLDPCDKHRDEGGGDASVSTPKRPRAFTAITSGEV
ncbi:hypothetical protein AGR7C_Lc210033 [Agrobacterium deltaense Zutra 3/1]|uniref:Uncharacterized protein n=1 Tax=Agrobacterium deltaense Zutra 3/1 TaxID=1183427 RepID=A0A1S7RQF4_9HYPH|nr:hypothetical protein AGR7C_Lc210033 [Agrobacterium deltaense Zutra 3/1]